MLYLRSPAYFSISTIAFLAFLGWFLIEIIGHSYADIITSGNNALTFNEISLQLFMYTTLLTLVCLATSWYADFTRTRAARNMSLTASTFTVFAWLWNLWFVIPAFRATYDSTNLFCNGGLAYQTRWCDLNRAAAAFCVCLEFTMFMTWVVDLVYWMTLRTPEIPIPTRATILAPHHSLVDSTEAGAHDADVSWNTELTEPDDLELLKITANNPSTHMPITQRVHIMGHISSFFTGTSIIGWLILTCALIDIARLVGLQAWQTTEDAQYNSLQVNNGAQFNGFNRLGDPIVAGNWYWLTLCLGTTLAVSSYSSYRRNRGIIGGALLLSLMSSLQWVSFFVYMCRRVKEQNTYNEGNPVSSIDNAKHSQYAEVAGAGIITASELVRSFVLFLRYMTYMMVTKLDHDRVHIPSHVDAPTVVQAERDHYNPNYANAYGGTAATNPQQDYTTAHADHAHAPVTEVNIPGPAYDNADGDLYVPSYNMGVFHGSSFGFRFFFVMQVLTLLGWWVLQVVQESNSGIFRVFGTNPEAGNVASGLNTQEAPDRSYYYNEYMFLLSSALVLGAWIPAFYAEREASVSAALASVYTSALMCLGFFLLVWTFSYESIYGWGTLYSSICTQGGNQWCRMTQAAGIFALINAFFLLCLFCHAVIRLAERRMMITVWERSVQNIPAGIAPLIIAAIGIWSFCVLYFGLYSDGVVAQLQTLNGVNVGNGYSESPIQAYFASQAFLTFATCAAAVWFGSYASKLLYAWQSWAWRMVSLFTSMAAAAFLVPLIIYAGRFIYNGSLSSGELALASAIIILCAGTAFYFAAFTFLIHTAFYAAGPAGAALPPTGMQLKGNQQFVANKYDGGVARDVEMGTVAAPAAYAATTTYGQRAEPVVNPRTGNTAVAVENYPATQTTTVSQPVYAVNQATTEYPQVVTAGGNGQVIYHDD